MPVTERFACPECGETERLDVVIMTSARIKQYGPEDIQTDVDESMDGSHEWDGDSMMHCIACGHSDKCSTFDREWEPEPIRCVACNTQGEHVLVQREVSGLPDLVCCEMVLERNLEANACPEPEDPQVIEAFRAAAKREYHREGETEIDDGAEVSISSDGGAYVQAWVWVSNEEADICACGEIITEEGGDGLCGSCADKADAEHTPVDENHEFSCAKCGARTHVKDAVLDEGYLYCSQTCQEKH